MENFESGILLCVIIATGLVMTWAMIKDKKKMGSMLDEIDTEILARNEAEDHNHQKEAETLLKTMPAGEDPQIDPPDPEAEDIKN